MHLAIKRLSISQIQNILSGVFILLKHFLVVLALVIAALIVINIIVKIVRLIRHLREPFLFLEITPPTNANTSSFSTTQFFNQIISLLNEHSFIDKLLLRDVSASFEIVSSKKDGIRYLIRVAESKINNVEKVFRSYLPSCKIQRAEDYLDRSKKSRILEFKQSKHFALPLRDHSDLSKHDPINYLTGAIKRLQENDLLALQIVLTPLERSGSFYQQSDCRRMRKTLKNRQHLDWSKNDFGTRIAMIVFPIVNIATQILMVPLYFATEFLTGKPPEFPNGKMFSDEPTPADLEYSQLAKIKLSEPLFSVGFRALISVDKKQIRERTSGIIASVNNFSHTCGQSLAIKKNIIFSLLKNWRFKRRIGGDIVLTVAEVASIFHFPFNEDIYNEDLQKIRSRELPVPLSFKKENPDLDVIFGLNDYAGNETAIGTTLDQRRKHTYIIGKTGTGKTTLLKSAIYQDMVNGKGLAVFDPHGDMFHELLEIVPENRRQDVVVFDPSDRAWPIGLNILSPGVKFLDKEDEEEWITSSVIGVFAKITAKEYWGPRMEHILRNATLTALQTENPSLYTLQRLLTDKSFQKKTAQSLQDPVLKQFWNKEFALLGKMQLSSVTAPLTQRLGLFITTKMSRHILLQEKSTINISQIMDEGKILLVNLAKGDLGEDQSFFFGTILTSIIWMAAYQRTKIPENKRRDFLLYVDEFQNFATPRFSEITSEGRKFRIGLIASHQNIAQVDDQKILQIVAGNANTIICLKASPDDEKFILPFMEPEVEPGDIVNLAPYHFYMKVSNEASENAFSGVTVPLDIEGSGEVKEAVLGYSRDKYASSREQVEKYLDELLSGKVNKPVKPKVKPQIAKTKVVEQRENKPKDAKQTGSEAGGSLLPRRE
jgi:hypothetical protein